MIKHKLPQRLADAKAAGWSRWIKNEADERAVMDGCYFDKAAAAHIVHFFEKYLSHTMGRFAGQPFKLLPWQKTGVMMPLFGWKKANGNRRFSKGDIFVAKKQGKSTLAAGLVNYFLVTSGQRAEVYGVAHTREQAGIIYREAAAMAQSSPQLCKLLSVRDSNKRIIYKQTNSHYHAMAGESSARGIEGINPVAVIMDEIHSMRSRVLYDGLAYASAARPKAIFLSVSTVGIADRTSVWWEQYEYARGILSGDIHDNARFAYVAQADEICDNDFAECGKVKQWAKAMPSLGVTVDKETVRRHWLEAKNSPAKQNAFRRYLLNRPTASVDRVVPMSAWYECATELPDLRGRECFGGLDLASREDLASYVLLFPRTEDDPRTFVIAWCWAPEVTIKEREARGMHHYRQWVDEGWLTPCGAKSIDHDVINSTIRESAEEYNLIECGVDPFGADAVFNKCLNDGLPLVRCSQSVYAMTPGTRAILDDIAELRIFHDGNPVLSWCLANCAALENSDGGIKFDRKSSSDKIDAAVALTMARARALAAENRPRPQPPALYF